MIICPQCKAMMREQWIKLHLEKGLSIPEVAGMSGYHQDTLYIWKSNYLKYGIEGLMDKSRAPLSHPNEYPSDVKQKIKSLRLEKKNRRIIGPVTIEKRLGDRYEITASRSGIAGFLKREGLVDPKRSRRHKKKDRIRKCKICSPGDLLQLDVKYSFKDRESWWYYQYSSIDYLSDVVYGNIFETQSNLEGILFVRSLVNFYPFSISGIQTDNHSTFTNRYTGYPKSSDPMNLRLHPFDLQCQKLSISHYLIDKGKPNQNGKVERFHRVCEEEFYQRETFKDLNSARKKFRDFLYYYNNEREHQGLDNMTPVEKLRTYSEYAKIKEITC